MFKVNQKDTKTTSMTAFWSLQCCFRTYFRPFSSVYIVDFELVNVRGVPKHFIYSTKFGGIPKHYNLPFSNTNMLRYIVRLLPHSYGEQFATQTMRCAECWSNPLPTLII